MKVLFRVNGSPVVQNDDGSAEFAAGMTIDADGCPSTYHPDGSPPGLDYLANAGKAGNWWALACNKDGSPIIQNHADPCPGFFVSTTSYKVPGFQHGDPRRELDSSKIPFIVVPSTLIRAVGPIVLGCRAVVRDMDAGTQCESVVGDVGPSNHLGEASMLLARQFGLSSCAKTGGTDEVRFKYLVWPGIAAPGYRLQAS